MQVPNFFQNYVYVFGITSFWLYKRFTLIYENQQIHLQLYVLFITKKAYITACAFVGFHTCT